MVAGSLTWIWTHNSKEGYEMDIFPVLLSCVQHFVCFPFFFLLVALKFTALSFTCADISLFDELEDLGDADELLEALVESVGYVSQNRFITHLFFLELEFLVFFKCIWKGKTLILKTVQLILLL